MYDGEVGRLFGVRFIEDPDAYVFRGTPFADKYDELTITKVDKESGKVYIAETLTSDDAAKIEAGVKLWINGKAYTASGISAGSNGTACLSVDGISDAFIEPDMKIYPGDGGADGKPVYSTVIVGKNAFGTSGDNNVEMINKSLGSAGTADPLNQRGTYGWKGYHFFKIIEQSKMCRIESVAEI